MYTKSQISKNCVICAVGPSIYLSTLIGVPCLKVSCTHSNLNSQKIVKFSTRSLCVSILIITYLLASLLQRNYAKKFEFHVNDDITNMALFIVNAGLCLRAVTIMVCCLIKVNAAKKMFLGIDEFLKNSKIENSKPFMREEDATKLRGRSFLSCAATMVSFVIYGLYLLQLEKYKRFYPFGKLPMLICFFVEFIFGLAFLGMVDIMSFLLTRFGEQLRIQITKEDKSKVILFERLLKDLMYIRNQYFAITKIIRGLNAFCDPLQVIWLILTTVILILHLYVIIVSFGKKDEYNQLIGMELQIQLSSALMTFALNVLQNLLVLVSNSFCTFASVWRIFFNKYILSI